MITGEGCLDGQTVMGKAPIGVAGIAKSFGKPVIAFSGCVTKEAYTCNAAGIDAFFPIQRGAVSLADAMNKKCRRKSLRHCRTGLPADQDFFRLTVSSPEQTLSA